METQRTLLKKSIRITTTYLLAVSLGGCAQTVVQPKYEQRIAAPVVRPSQVLVYDFAITDIHVRENQGLFATVGHAMSGTTKNDREMAIAHKVQLRMAEDIVAGIRNHGLPAQRVEQGTVLPTDAVAVTGHFLNVDEGDRMQRTVLGFGAGQSTVETKVEVYAPSTSGPTKLLEFKTHADSGAAPGALVTGGAGAAANGGMTVGIAAANLGLGGVKGYRSQIEHMTARSADQAVAYLSQYFAKQGWIPQEKVQPAKTSQ